LKTWIQILAICLLLPLHDADGQTLPPIRVFTPDEYGADNQNWQITQGSDKFIYVANNRGLLEFNGADWNLYPSPNNTIIRCVKAIETGYIRVATWSLDTGSATVTAEWNILRSCR
jgi:hypothetical protein